MALLNIKKQFVEPIRKGTNHHTIRAMRKIPVKCGEKLYLYCGCRQKGAFRILPEPQICTRVQSIKIEMELGGERVTIDGNVIDLDERKQLALADGFESLDAFRDFWENVHGEDLPNHGRIVNFTGQIIHWR